MHRTPNGEELLLALQVGDYRIQRSCPTDRRSRYFRGQSLAIRPRSDANYIQSLAADLDPVKWFTQQVLQLQAGSQSPLRDNQP